jgi:signal peptidase I
VDFKQDGDKFIYTIYSPHVHKPQTNFKTIRFQPGDRVTVEGSGCVQTGGIGPTWKRYVDPFAPDALSLYHGLVGMPYLTRTLRDSGTVPGLVRIQKLIGRVYVVPAYKGDSAEPYYLRLGYEDSNYEDNGYDRHDNGTGGQCYRTTAAKVVITITREVPTSGGFNLEGSWSYTAISSSGAKFRWGLTLLVNGSAVTGSLQTPDGSRPYVSGTYDQATGTLTLTRDTGLDNIQKYTLRRLGNKMSGFYSNEGKYPDSGTIEIVRITL